MLDETKRVAWNKGLRTGLAPWLGKTRGPHSEATKARMRAAQLGKPKSAAHRAAIAAARTGAKHTPESREKNRLAHLGKKHTPEGLAKIRAVNAARSGPTHQWWGKASTHGPRTHWIDYNGVKLRSSYEVRLARALDERGLAWMYEPRRFDLGTCTFLPDFYLPDVDEYWEVKGWFDPKSVEKIRLFQERYSDLTLVVVDNEVLTMMEEAA